MHHSYPYSEQKSTSHFQGLSERMTSKFGVPLILLLLANFAILLCTFSNDAKSNCSLRDDYCSSSRVAGDNSLPRGYLVNLKYDGQQASAEHALVLQQCWLGALNLSNTYIVEPFLRQTVYQGYPPQQIGRGSQKALLFSDLHDLDHYNTVSRRRGFAQVATWQDFLKNSPRRVVFVNLGSTHLDPTHYSMECPNNTSQNCCLLSPNPDGLDFFTRRGYCVVKIINIHTPGHTLGDESLREHLYGSWRPEDVTVVFRHWMQANSAQHFSQCYRIFRRSVMTELLAPSKQLLEESAVYRDMFLGGRMSPVLSVMIRVERVIEQSVEGGHAVVARQNGAMRRAYLDKCFKSLFETADKLSNNTEPFVMADIGKFSSNSWNRILTELNYSKSEARHVFDTTRRAVERLVNQSFTQWEGTFVRSTANSSQWKSPAYISALQRTIAVSSDCLLLFGGGNFQEVALSAYLQKHPSKSTQCVHIVCASKSLQRNLIDIL